MPFCLRDNIANSGRCLFIDHPSGQSLSVSPRSRCFLRYFVQNRSTVMDTAMKSLTDTKLAKQKSSKLVEKKVINVHLLVNPST